MITNYANKDILKSTMEMYKMAIQGFQQIDKY